LFISDKSNSQYTTLSLINYFRRIKQHTPKENIVLERKALFIDRMPVWEFIKKPICHVDIFLESNIELDYESQFHADFANRIIGGGVLHGGLAQEETLFSSRPECIISILFCTPLYDSESFIISGPELFNTFGDTRTFDFKYHVEKEREIFEETGSRAINVIAVDAQPSVGMDQFLSDSVRREINKLYSGLMDWKSLTSSTNQSYSTGHWGCGTFGGDKHLKAIEQIIVCSQVGMNIRYFCCWDEEFYNQFMLVVKKIEEKDWRICDLLNIISESIIHISNEISLFDFILNLN